MITDAVKRPLPSGWRWAKLGEIADFLDHRRVPVDEFERNRRIAGKPASELYPYYGANGQIGWIDGYLFDEDLVLLAEDGGFFGARDKPIAYRVSGKCWVNNHAHVLRPKPGVDIGWLHLSLMIRPDVGKMVTGSTRAKLNQKVAAQIPVLCPPLDEQRRIAARLSEQMAQVDKMRSVAEAEVEAAEALPAAFLRQVFESEEAKKWPRRKLGELCNDIYRYPSFYGMEHLPTGVPVVRGEHIDKEGEISTDWSQYWLVSPTVSRTFPRTVLQEGDLVFTVRGTIGKAGIVRNSHQGAQLSPNLIRISPLSSIESEYLWYYFQTIKGSGNRVQESASTVATVKASDLAALEIPLPPLAEQERIAAHLSQQMRHARSLRQAAKAQAGAVDALPASLLGDVFGGFEPPS